MKVGHCDQVSLVGTRSGVTHSIFTVAKVHKWQGIEWITGNGYTRDTLPHN